MLLFPFMLYWAFYIDCQVSNTKMKYLKVQQKAAIEVKFLLR